MRLIHRTVSAEAVDRALGVQRKPFLIFSALSADSAVRLGDHDPATLSRMSGCSMVVGERVCMQY